jgi:hypothetical protein
MRRKKLGLIHTSATLVPVFDKLCRARLPGVEVFNIADDSLIKDVIARGELTAKTARRVACRRVGFRPLLAPPMQELANNRKTGRAGVAWSVVLGLPKRIALVFDPRSLPSRSRGVQNQRAAPASRRRLG